MKLDLLMSHTVWGLTGHGRFWSQPITMGGPGNLSARQNEASERSREQAGVRLVSPSCGEDQGTSPVPALHPAQGNYGHQLDGGAEQGGEGCTHNLPHGLRWHAGVAVHQGLCGLREGVGDAVAEALS